MRFKKTLACLMAGAMIGGGAGALVPGWNSFEVFADDSENEVQYAILEILHYESDGVGETKVDFPYALNSWESLWVKLYGLGDYNLTNAYIVYDITSKEAPGWEGEGDNKYIVLKSYSGYDGLLVNGKTGEKNYTGTITAIPSLDQWGGFGFNIQAGHGDVTVNSIKLYIPLPDYHKVGGDGFFHYLDTNYWEQGSVTASQVLGDTAPEDVESITFTGDIAFKIDYTSGGENKSVENETSYTLTDMDLVGSSFFFGAGPADNTDHKVLWTVTTHTFGEVSYSWADDNSKCTATVTCTKAGCTGKVTETVDTTSAEKTPPTCTDKGTTTYTATFTNSKFTTQSKDVDDINATDHAYGEPEYVWSDDNSTCTATVKCTNDASHVITETVTSTSNETAKATCTTKGSVTYSASFEDAHFTAQSKDVDINPLGVLNTETGNYEHKWRVENGVKGACEICQQEYCDHEGMETEVRDAKTASCTEKGYTGDIYCKNCGSKIGTGSEIALVDHTWSEWTVTTAPQIGVKGVETRTCSVCKTEENNDIDAVAYESDDVENGVVTWSEEDGEDLVLTFHRSTDDENAIDYYVGVKIDGEEAEAEGVKGSVKITISKDDLASLENGEHDLTIEFTDGKLELKLNVVRRQAADTADAFPAGVIIMLMTGAVCAAVLGLRKRRPANRL
ncbi:MAG: hypothetical protein IKN24_04910 [Lachnospiraceae bacterium]|nr:hypothetical protein [Lachnospiraceae bacterium]